MLMTETVTFSDVLDEWFGELDEQGIAPKSKVRRWFSKDANFDQALRERFGTSLELAVAGGLSHWESEPQSTLALIILLDQFSRNVFRDTPRMYAADDRAASLSVGLLARGVDASLPFHHRVFLYMPLMHAEDLQLQVQCVKWFEALCAEQPSDTETEQMCRGYVQYAKAHRDIVARFGRFPHRNELLSRETTLEEAEFLKEPGSSF